jgi:hypothetical protein
METSEKPSKNNLYNNAIINSINGIVVKTGASNNTFHLNKIVNATEVGILNVKEILVHLKIYLKTKTN